MNFIFAEKQHLPRIMELINQAKVFLKDCGVDQWQQGYPNQACIEQDISSQKGYLCLYDQKIIGYICIDFSGEPAYDKLTGNWLSIQPYVVLRRLALDNTIKGKGLTFEIFRFVEDMCRQKEIHSIKTNTDNGNQIMKHILPKNGFQFCGTVWFQNSEKIAYEKLI